jgi:hypothetical protein
VWAAYTLGVGVGGAAAAAALLPPLRELPAEAAMGEEEEKEELSSKFDESDPGCPSAAAVVPPPCRPGAADRGAGRGAARSARPCTGWSSSARRQCHRCWRSPRTPPRRRDRAFDVLGDMGPQVIA